MNHKVLLADDSLTIQKVIKITLANQPYEITECSSEEELFQKLPLVQPKIIFLDFNLSEKYTGYELTQKIKSLMPNSKILLLLGTFDSVDDEALLKCGASDKIVKPFDSNKFIAICKQLSSSLTEKEEVSSPEVSVEKSALPSIDSDDQWKMTHSQEVLLEKEIEAPVKELPKSLNALNQEVSDWGMSVPGVINDTSIHDKQIDLPPIIGEGKNPVAPAMQEVKPEISKYETKFPSNDDLDYPDMGASSAPVETKKETSASSKLISLETFNESPLEIEEYHSNEETNVSSIEAQIRDEVEQDLWHADEFEELKREVSDKIEQIKNDFQPTMKEFDESLFRPLDENDSIVWNQPSSPEASEKPSVSATVSHDELRSEIEDLVKRYVKEYMDQMFQKSVEKISWEVIPDLAENLIRQELGKISNKILNE